METTSAPSERRPGLLTGIALLVPITMAVMGVVVLAPVLPQMQSAFRNTPHSEFLVPMVLTTPALCVLLFSWLAGIAGDAFGRRRLLIGSMIVYAALGVTPIFLNDLTSILVSRVGVGICEAMVMTLSTTLIGDVFHGPTRDRWLASQTAVASLSALVLLNLGGLLGRFGWRGPFVIYASSLLMVLLILKFTWEPKREDETGADTRKLGWADFPWTWMAGVVLVTMFGAIMFYIVQIQAAFGLNAHGIVDPAQIGFLTSLASLGVPLGTVAFQFVSRMPTAALFALEFAILGTGFVEMTHGATANEFLLGAAINQFGAGMILPTMLTWAMRPLPFDIRSRGTGIWMAAISAGQFLSPIVITLVSKQTGGLLPAFQVLGFACFAAGVLALANLVFVRRTPKLATGAPR